MSIRWMAVQYVDDTLRIPVGSEDDMDKPFGSSVLEREVKRIVVNPFSDSSQTFVPEEKVAKLREGDRRMNKVISEILFNRGLMWIILAYLRALREDTNGKLMPFMFFALAVYNFYKSWKAFGTEE